MEKYGTTVYYVLIFYFPFLTMYYCRFGRDNFEESAKMASSVQTTNVDWTKFKYMVFDIPTMLNEPYQKRYARLGRNYSLLKVAKIC